MIDADRELPTAWGLKVDMDLRRAEHERRAPYYVMRLLNGACTQNSPDGAVVHIRSCGNEYVVDAKAFAHCKRIADRVRKEHLDPRGFSQPFNLEGQILIHSMAETISRCEYELAPSKLRVYFMRQDSGGVGFYRVMQPVAWLQQESEIIEADQTDYAATTLFHEYDIIVAPRACQPRVIGMLKTMQQSGALIVYETDDLMDAIPDWNPAKRSINPMLERFRQTAKREADAIIVSTPELAEAMDRPEVTHVCMNGIDPNRWPMRVYEPDKREHGSAVRIMWAGSNTHEEDLELIVPAVDAVIKHEPNAHFTWVGMVPRSFVCGVYHEGRVKLQLADQYKGRMKADDNSSPFEWSNTLARQQADIILAPLVDIPFNRAKSELKVIEAWALGIPIIASDVAPYRRAIENNVNGILVPPDTDSWVMAMRRLIRNPKERIRLAKAGLETLKERYTMDRIVKQYEKAFLTIARGKTRRPECNDAIEAALKAMGE